MDFAAPPEITSALIYSGPGPGSLSQAAMAWQRLAEELEHAAIGFTATITTLRGAWSGPSADAMAANTAQHIAWLTATAQQARQTGMAAAQATTAYQTVRATITPPAVVAANRLHLQTLLATNLLGQNAAAIAATEAQYAAMWARNTAAMGSYSTASQSATSTLSTGFTSPPAASDPTTPAISADTLIQSAATLTASISQQGPIPLLQLFAQAWFAQGVQTAAGDLSGGMSAGFGSIGANAFGGVSLPPIEGAIGAAGLAPEAAAAAETSASMGTAVPLGAVSAPATSIRLLSAATPLTELGTGALGAPLIAPITGVGRNPRPEKPTERKPGWREADLRVSATTPRHPSGG